MSKDVLVHITPLADAKAFDSTAAGAKPTWFEFIVEGATRSPLLSSTTPTFVSP